MDNDTRAALDTALAELAPQAPIATRIRVVDLIERAIDDAVDIHREDSPHIYADGSTY